MDQLRSGALKGTQKLKMSCGLTQVPEEIYTLADSLEILDLSGNQLSELPQQLSQLKKLKIVFFSDNEFTVFPEVLSLLPNLEMIGFKANKINTVPEHSFPPKLRWLILTNNRLAKLPDSIGMCVHMQKLMLAGNRLRSLPESMRSFQKLELLRISANAFENLPQWLLQLPKLAWLAFGGNPCLVQHSDMSAYREVPWPELKVAEQLGEGASGNIFKVQWLHQEYALKVFKGDVTSDGLPSDEMRACMRAGSHPNLIPIEGILTQHPQQRKGLLMKLLPQRYKALAGPPSFATCTRDVYATDTKFTLQHVLKTAQAVASICVHLHALGLMHGDLYAHNILIDSEHHTLLSDFGAGWVYDLHDRPVAKALQQIEVRAFGCILEELLTYMEVSNTEASSMLITLKERCLQETVSHRPCFEEIMLELIKMETID